MQQEINVTEEDIKYAESILLPEGKTFDEERVRFIENFETIDLLAVPGSGKTTALLAKLLILEKKLPLLNNRGILILSHTNTAVDEIKEKIGKHCPKLFSYPNFIGTIQSFVDQFLGIPFYTLKFQKRPLRIDTEIFWETFLKQIHRGSKTALERRLGNNFKSFIEELFIRNETLVHFNSFETLSIPKIGSHTNTHKNLFCLKKDMLVRGILNFNDMYSLANIYMETIPSIKRIIKERFKYVFVDEMQDMDIHQFEILEKIFIDETTVTSIYQRIGDKNQSIYSGGEIKIENNIWNDRGIPLVIKGSQRLSKSNAELVSCFALNRDGDFEIIGKNEKSSLKPHLIVYSLDNIKRVIPEFSKLIHDYMLSGQIEILPKNKYKVIGWSKDKTNDSTKLGIKDFYEELVIDSTKQKIDYENLDSYLKCFDRDKKTLEPIRKNILNALIKVLRLEELYFSKRELLNHLQINHNENLIKLERNLYLWSINIIRGKFDEVYTSIKSYISDFLSIFNKSVNNSSSFINDPSTQQTSTSQLSVKSPNKENYHGFDINISTIHSVKGETHTATLYLETYYQNGNDNYETERLSDQFKYINFNKTQKYHKQSTKMAYVGFSRPTHLLCVAVCKSRFDTHLSNIDRSKWEVIEI